ncbi:hypothetical protein CWR48_11930 [Oceanobacillus arenosus]|uniref:Uncharacterized protein n=1 Tax=Oceanobacillus arenosus TaxID=1229153 RepID=A0A3D8PQ63_9BACI|nr:hypothetical protein [Oceanobacillus arenosus]RDW18286.1 hypothetical protein CWR48_11930 [Oceanobacillus arenosus]
MSDNKQVIHVKDLVIKADNVIIENSHRRDPLFGNHRERRNEERVSEHNEQQEHHESNNHHREEESEARRERRPFWF